MTNNPPAPRGAIPNWQPATTIDDYLRSCEEGLEEYSDRRAAKLLGWSRMRVYRAKAAASLPDALFEHLLAQGCRMRDIANVALAFERGEEHAEAEHCPHCGGQLRVRSQITTAARTAIRAWLDEGERGAG